MLMKKVRAGLAIDTIFSNCTYVTCNGKTVKLVGAAHKTWVSWRRKLWNQPV